MTNLLKTRSEHARLRLEVTQELEDIFARSRRTAEAYGPEFLGLWDLAADHAQGGKLIRPLLMLEMFEALGSNEPSASNRSEAVRIAAAIEVLHFAFLLHDDVIDGDLVRRGRPNLIGELATSSFDETHSDAAQHWAKSGAILAGDLLLSATHQLFARANVSGSLKERLLDLLEHTIFETTAGEFVDVGLSDGVIRSDLSTVLQMTGRKTACYSFELPLRAAVILSGGSQELERRLSTAGAHLGLAYQLQDDLLSTFGDAAAHGKDAYSDLREGKQTAIISFARMSNSWPSIEPDFADPQLSFERAEHLRDLLRECGAEDFVLGLIQEQLGAFYESLAVVNETASIPTRVRDVLLDLAARFEGRKS
ncbi:polyprenyl synthetase family protein [Leucobacter denitrificans]|uniref:Polyprenyl synthetase family protein n=1 Tax=Leucobacter denitrificans TaxID=683042 RepID=A0A7G9S3W4_9MICO|nr:polyprenyl synthetase family protein [Leucobacter denitrificans]QNN62539.1 polyprenyl synthetase family protein [Leucobacter denitrificans]